MQNSPFFSSKNLAEIEHLLRTVASGEIRAARIIAGGDGFRCNATQLDILPMFSLASDIDSTFDFRPVDYIRVVLQTGGNSKIVVDGAQTEVDGRRSSYILPEGRSATEVHPSGYGSLAVRIQPEQLRQKLAALCDIAVPERVVFGTTVNIDERFSEFVRKPLMQAARELTQSSPLFHRYILEEVRAITLTRLLLFAPHNLSALFDARTPAPSRTQMRQAEDYAAANWDKVIDVATLAAAAGVSARTILRYFREIHGETPRNYIKRIRLDRAREMLRGGDETTVMGVALKCRFGGLGHFAEAYRRRFGELPSETLRERQRDTKPP